MSQIDYDEDIVKVLLQGAVCRKVTYDEVEKFMNSKEGQSYLLSYDDVFTSVLEKYDSYIPENIFPLEPLLFRQSVHCINPTAKLENTLWMDIGNIDLYTDEINEILKKDMG